MAVYETSKTKLTSLDEDTLINEDNTREDQSLLSTKQVAPTMRQTGTVVANQNTVAVSDISRNRDRADLHEMDWNYKSITSKPYIVNTFTWEASTPIGNSVFTINLPNDYFSANSVLKAVGETFTAFRGDIRFLVTVQSTPNVSGALILSPNYQLYSTYPSLHTPFLRQHLIIDASNNSFTGEIVVPFRFYRNSMSPFAKEYALEAKVLAPLAGLDRVAVTVAAYLEDQEFRFLRPKADANLKITQGLINVNVTNNNLSQIENATVPTTITGDELDANISMMDDVGLPTNPQQIIVKYNSLNNVDNPHCIDKATLNSKAQQVSTFDTFNTQIDEMDIGHICKERDHYLETYRILPTALVKTVVFNGYLTPTPVVSTLGIGSDRPISAMELVSSYAKFWRGGLRYKFRFFMNRFQSVRLYAALFYNINEFDPALVDYSSSHGVMIDIGGDKREFEIVVPYNALTPWLGVPKDAISAIPDYNGQNTSTITTDYCMGRLVVYMVSPLVSSSGDNNAVHCVTTFSAAEDFELATLHPQDSHNFENFKVTQGLVLADYSSRTSRYQEDTIVSLKQILKKWQPDVEEVFDAGTSVFNIGSPVNTYTQLPIAPPNNWLFYYGNDILTSMYTGLRGSIKVRIEVDTNRANMVTLRLYNANALTNDLPALDSVASISKSVPLNEFTPVNVTADGNLIYEIEVPYQRNLKYHQVSRIGSTADVFNSYGYLILTVYSPLNTNIGSLIVRRWVKFGDDARLGILNGINVTSKDLEQSFAISAWKNLT